jgi:hypothetical protein
MRRHPRDLNLAIQAVCRFANTTCAEEPPCDYSAGYEPDRVIEPYTAKLYEIAFTAWTGQHCAGRRHYLRDPDFAAHLAPDEVMFADVAVRIVPLSGCATQTCFKQVIGSGYYTATDNPADKSADSVCSG